VYSRPFTPARFTVLVAVVLGAVALTPLAAQQAPGSGEATGPGEAAAATAGQASSPSTALPGPRLPQWRRFEPSFAPNNASERAFLAPAGGNTTIVISTLALVIIVVLVALLIV
jgi:hypothetical protein